MKKIYLKIREKLEKIKIFSYFYFHGARLNSEQLQNKKHWIYLLYLEKKYKKFLNKLEIYKNSNEFSNKVWWCWLQGEENAPDLNKACLNSLRENLKDREIIIITEENYSQYIELPEYIISKYKKGLITKTHFSDILRIELLVKFGGTWIDSSVLCTSYDSAYFDKNLFVYQNWKRGDEAILISNWFITAEKHNPILLTTRDLLYEYWRKNDFVIHYFIFHFFFTISAKKYEEQWNAISRFSNIPPHILQFELFDKYSEERFNQIAKMSSFHKLNQKLDFNKASPESNYYYIINKYKN